VVARTSGVPSYPCDYFYMLVNDRIGKWLEVAGGSTANQDRIQQRDCHGQSWQIWQPALSSSGNEPLLC
jgi:protein involved in polysaccharide export with SLBB domain